MVIPRRALAGGLGQHPVELLLNLRGERIAAAAALPFRADLNRLAHRDRHPQRPMDAGFVGQVLLVPLDGFENPLDRRLLREVIDRVAGELLGEIAVGQVSPAAGGFCGR